MFLNFLVFNFSLIVGESGIVILEDLYLFEKNVYFNCECVFECVVYVKGVGVYGYFEVIK